MKPVSIIGAGPAGLMAAEVISRRGIPVNVYEAMPSPGRKFLRAGVGGLNLTHSETRPAFDRRYHESRTVIGEWLNHFDPEAVRDWARSLGIDTFVGSSGRVFPVEMKAAPLLRAWLRRLHDQGVTLHVRHRWQGWNSQGDLLLTTPDGPLVVGAGETAAVVIALGGASWARLGADGLWAAVLAARGVALTPFAASNVGVEVAWSTHLSTRFAGQALKGVCLHIDRHQQLGECIITRHGLEGGVIYALGAQLREALLRQGSVTVRLDLLPDLSEARVLGELQKPRGRDSLANHLRRRLRLQGAKAAVLREMATPEQLADSRRLAALIKALPISLTGLRPLNEAISTAGGIRLDQLDDDLMLKHLPGVFCAGEMLDWDAPTGGYLLTACLASGRVVGQGVVNYLAREGDGPKINPAS